MIRYGAIPEAKKEEQRLRFALLPFPGPFLLAAGTEVTRVCVCVCVLGLAGGGVVSAHVSLRGYGDYILNLSLPQM